MLPLSAWVCQQGPAGDLGESTISERWPRLKGRYFLLSTRCQQEHDHQESCTVPCLPKPPAPPAALTTLPSSPTLSPRPQHLKVRHSTPSTHTPAFAGVSMSPSRPPRQAGLLTCPTRCLPIPGVGGRKWKEKRKKGSRQGLSISSLGNVCCKGWLHQIPLDV